MSKWLPEVAPAAGDIKIVNTAQDRFYNTDLDKALKAKGITTIIMVGWKVSGSLTYTSVGATLRDYTVVIPVDTTAAATDYETDHRFLSNIESGQWQPDERAFEAKSPNAEPHGHDHLPVRTAGLPTGQGHRPRFTFAGRRPSRLLPASSPKDKGSESRESVEWRRGSALNLIDVQREHEFPAFEPLCFSCGVFEVDVVGDRQAHIHLR